MRQLSKLYFASSNNHKFQEARDILESLGIDLLFYRCSLEEIQSKSIKEIAQHKAKKAFVQCQKPIIVEDAALEIDSLDQFPGPYSSYFFKTIGNQGILKLIKKNRKAKFRSVITYCDKKNLISFESKTFGKISNSIRGMGWGYDPIFIPCGKSKTYAELQDKNSVSHRYKSLKKFSSWFLNR